MQISPEVRQKIYPSIETIRDLLNELARGEDTTRIIQMQLDHIIYEIAESRRRPEIVDYRDSELHRIRMAGL